MEVKKGSRVQGVQSSSEKQELKVSIPWSCAFVALMLALTGKSDKWSALDLDISHSFKDNNAILGKNQKL